MHRNSSDLPFVIVELARLSKHSEWLINPLRFLVQKNIRPMITHQTYDHPLTMQLYYFELRVPLYRVRHVDLARSSASIPIDIECARTQFWDMGAIKRNDRCDSRINCIHKMSGQQI